MDDFERFIGDLDELENQPEAPRFAHSFTTAGLDEVIGALADILRAPWPDLEEIFTGLKREEERQVLLAPAAGGVILWHSTKTLPFIVALSERLPESVHWINVFEEITIRAYGCLKAGEWDPLITDPVTYWRDNVLDADDMIGAGERRFPDLDAFLSEVERWYVPVDTVWDFECWNDDARRTENLETGISDFDRCLRLSAANARCTVEVIGTWSGYEIDHVRGIFVSGRN